MSEMKHTPEPWVVHAHVVLARGQNGASDANISFCTKRDGSGRYALEMPYEECEANASRIVACVNACKDVSNKWLQENSIRARIQEISLLKKQNQVLIDTIMAIVEEGIDEESISQLREAVDHCKKIIL